MKYSKKRQYIVIVIILFFLAGIFKVENRMIKNVSAITPVVNTILEEYNSLEHSLGYHNEQNPMYRTIYRHLFLTNPLDKSDMP